MPPSTCRYWQDDRSGSCRRLLWPTASYTTPRDTIITVTSNAGKSSAKYVSKRRNKASVQPDWGKVLPEFVASFYDQPMFILDEEIIERPEIRLQVWR